MMKLQKGKSNFISDHKNLELDCEFDGEPVKRNENQSRIRSFGPRVNDPAVFF